MKSSVAIYRVDSGIDRAVTSAMDTIGWTEIITRDTPVCIKVNLTHDLLLPGSIVSPAVARAVCLTMLDRIDSLVLAESSQVVTDADKAYRVSGYERTFRDMPVRWHNMTHHPYHAVTIDDERLLLPDIISSHQMVNLCVMKTHFRSVISGALKNFWGFLETGRERFHADLPRKIAQLHTHIPSALHIMDGVIAMEGNGPKSGIPREVGLVMASRDPVALDSVAARLMGFDPAVIEHIQHCAERDLGVWTTEDIEILGDMEILESLHFKPARKNFVARMEDIFKRLGFSGSTRTGGGMKLLSWGARQWYQFAYAAFGTKRRIDRFIENAHFDGGWK